jgi:hypothetical protein
MKEWCRVCEKKAYGRMRAFHAALGSSHTFGTPTRVYPCPVGNGFHITTKVKRVNDHGSG